jgi:hypothetical protein
MKYEINLMGFQRFDVGTYLSLQSTISISCNLIPTWDAGKVCQVFRKNNLPQHICMSGALIALRFYY